MISIIEGLRKKKRKALIDSENRLVVAGVRVRDRRVDAGDEKVQTCSYKRNAWGCHVQHGNNSLQYSVAYI